MGHTGKLNFVLQQGFRDTLPAECDFRYSALMWQPRVIGIVVLVGLVLQTWPLFLVLSAVLWWNVALPRWNPFDALYNRLIAAPRNLPRLAPSPGPRRFEQGMAGSFALGIAASLFFGRSGLAYTLEAFMVVALAALIFGRFCMGSYIFLLLKGDRTFASRTLPWTRSS